MFIEKVKTVPSVHEASAVPVGALFSVEGCDELLLRTGTTGPEADVVSFNLCRNKADIIGRHVKVVLYKARLMYWD